MAKHSQGRPNLINGLPSQIWFFMIGANDFNDNENGGVPSGARMSANVSAPQSETNSNQDINGLIHCGICNSGPFKGKKGLGVHIRRAHPVEANAAINIDRVKARWSEEETKLLAKEEARATNSGIVNMNQHLLNVFPKRTLESIKGKRRAEAYKQLVQEYVRGRTDEEVETPIPEDVFTCDDALRERIHGLIVSLEGNNLQSTQTLIGYARRVLDNVRLESGTLFGWLKTTFKDAKPPRGIMYRGQVVDANMSKSKRSVAG